MSKSLKSMVAVAACLVLAVALNPSADKHRATIKDTIAERSQLENLLGVGSLTAFASKYHSFGVASCTTLNDELLSVGAFGIVIVIG
jgi:hypothetical protein